MNVTRLLFSLLFLALARLPFAAKAEIISYTNSFSYDLTYQNLTQLPWTNVISVPQWNPALYPGQILQSITFELAAVLKVDVAVDNAQNTAGTDTITKPVTYNVTRPDTTTLISLLLNASAELSVGPDTDVGIFPDFLGTDSARATVLTNGATSTQANFPNTDLPLFTGSGSISVNLIADSSSTSVAPGNWDTQIRTFGGGQLIVRYEVVPEASTWMAGASMVGLGLLWNARRVRRQRSAEAPASIS